MKADLHIHTYYSDGIYSPEKIVDLAIEHGLEAIALTDHDNILSYDVAQKYIQEKGENLELIRGIEVNTLYKGMEVHILGYFMDVKNKDFVAMLKAQQQARVKQTKEILALLKKKEVIKIKYEDVKQLVAENGSIGRPHIARAIAKDPEIFIFDDSFSALDFKTDAKLRKALKTETENSTVLIVAQRISTILDADQIVVLDEGRIVGKGTHKELLKNCEIYKEIALSQLSKEELENE